MAANVFLYLNGIAMLCWKLMSMIYLNILIMQFSSTEFTPFIYFSENTTDSILLLPHLKFSTGLVSWRKYAPHYTTELAYESRFAVLCRSLLQLSFAYIVYCNWTHLLRRKYYCLGFSEVTRQYMRCFILTTDRIIFAMVDFMTLTTLANRCMTNMHHAGSSYHTKTHNNIERHTAQTIVHYLTVNSGKCVIFTIW